MITVLGGLFVLALAVVLVLRRPQALAVILAAAVPFPHSAAVVVGGASLSCFHVVALAAAIRFLWLLRKRETRAALSSRRLRLPLVLLLVFAGYALLVTAVGPALFAGLPVYAPRGGIDQQSVTMTPLAYTLSNLAQPIYLVVDLLAMLLLVVDRNVSRRLFEVSIATGLVLGLIRGLLPPTLIDPLLDTMTNVSYFTVAFDTRWRGTFSEASIFGLFLIASLAYTVAAALRSRGRRLALMLALAALAVVGLALNRSGTALIALIATALIAGLVAVGSWVRDGRRVVRGSIVAAVVLAVTVLLVSPIGSGALTVFNEKAGTQSFFNRTRSDGAALTLLAETFGVGTGLGSNRSSSLVPTLLSTAGAIGGVALLAAIVVVIVRSLRTDLLDPPTWGLVGTLVAQATAVSDLSFPLLWILGGLVLRRLLLVRDAPQDHRAARRGAKHRLSTTSS